MKLPLHCLQFDDAVRDRRSTGSGDPHFFARVESNLFGIGGVPTAVMLRRDMKVPARSSENDAEIVSVSVGRRNREVVLQAERILHP